MSLPYNLEFMLSKVQHDIAMQQESILMTQLNELISRGLLEVRQTKPALIRRQDSDTIELVHEVKLVLKDQEYIEKLEAEITELRKNLDYVKEFAERLTGIQSNKRGPT